MLRRMRSARGEGVENWLAATRSLGVIKTEEELERSSQVPQGQAIG